MVWSWGFFIGFIIVITVPDINTSKWTPGTPGLLFGLGYLGFICGMVLINHAAIKIDKEYNRPQSKWEAAIIRGLRNVPKIIFLGMSIILFASSAVWSIASNAQAFGKNEAKLMLSARPEAVLSVDSQIGFEDIVSVNGLGDVTIEKIGIIIEANGILYFSNNFTIDSPQLNVRAIPLSRIKAIKYCVDVNQNGE